MTDELSTTPAGVFASGWRPTVGWIIAAGFAVQFVVLPIFNMFLAYLGKPINSVGLDTVSLVSLTTGVLGLGGLRTYEKVKDVASQ